MKPSRCRNARLSPPWSGPMARNRECSEVMKVEVFHAPGCPACVGARADLQSAARQAVRDLGWHEVNAAGDLDRAVGLCVLTLPSIGLDGELVFSSMADAMQVR